MWDANEVALEIVALDYNMVIVSPNKLIELSRSNVSKRDQQSTLVLKDLTGVEGFAEMSTIAELNPRRKSAIKRISNGTFT